MTPISYPLTEDDVVEFGIAHSQVSSLRRRRIAIVFLVTLLLGGVFFVKTRVGEWWVWVIAMALFAPIVPKLIDRMDRYLLRRALRAGSNQAALGQTTLELDDAGVRRSNALSESRVAWAGVERLFVSKSYLGVFISSVQAFVVPRRAFATPETEADFRAELERRSGHRFSETGR